MDFITTLALAAGKLSLEEFSRLRDSDIELKGEKDIVTAADRAVEHFIVSSIRERYPDHGVFGEESGKAGAQDGYLWVIDPIDGTASFVRDLPFYSISIALQYRGETLKAAVYAPRLNELFLASREKGATLNGRPLKVSGKNSLSSAMLSTGFACLRAGMSDNNLKYFNRIVPQVMGIRRHGSAAMDLCYVAAGRFDAFWELNLQPYDYAAGVLIVEEAGGRVRDFNGGRDFSARGIIASNRAIDAELDKYLVQ